MASRATYSETSDPMPNGLQFLEQYADLLGLLFDTSILPLTAVGGTGNAVTATLDPPLLAGLVTGMKFTLTFAAANTGPVTLALNGAAAVPVLDASGLDLTPGDLAAGQRGLIEFVGGVFRVLSSGGAGGGGQGRFYQAFTVSGTWTKPVGLDDDTMVTVEGWGGGGAGAVNGCGGGGGYAMRRIRIGDLPSTVTVTIGAGGTAGAGGGNTAFGAFLTAYGGGGSQNNTNGGGGGGEIERGFQGNAGSPLGAGGALGGGNGGLSSNPGSDARLPWGGGGGASNSGSGGRAIMGGGGGGNTSGGVSVYAGNGGVNGVAGSAPAGGGGRNAAGARGEVRVWI